MNIFHQIKNSVYGPEYYKKIVAHTRLRSSVKYLAKLSLAIAALAVVAAIVSWPLVSKKATKGLDSLVTLYPSELEVNIVNGEASINQPEPYFIKTKDGENLFVINTKEDFSISKFRSYGTDFMLSKTELIGVKNEGTGQLQIMPLPKDDVTINQVTVSQSKDWLVKKMPVIFLWTLIFGFVALFLMIFSGTLIANIFYALGVWIFANVFKWSLSYKKSYQLGLHAATLGIFISCFTFFGIFKFFDSFSMKLLLVLVIVYINFKEHFHKKPKSEESAKSEEATEVEVKEIN